MLASFRQARHKFSRGWLAALAGLWLFAAFAPCIAQASAVCNGPCPQMHGSDTGLPTCDATQAFDCQLQDEKLPIVLLPMDDVAPTVRLSLLPPATQLVLVPLGVAPDVSAAATPPPLSLRPAVLLI